MCVSHVKYLQSNIWIYFGAKRITYVLRRTHILERIKLVSLLQIWYKFDEIGVFLHSQLSQFSEELYEFQVKVSKSTKYISIMLSSGIVVFLLFSVYLVSFYIFAIFFNGKLFFQRKKFVTFCLNKFLREFIFFYLTFSSIDCMQLCSRTGNVVRFERSSKPNGQCNNQQ